MSISDRPDPASAYRVIEPANAQYRGSRPSDSFLTRSEGLVHAGEAPTRFMVASGGVVSEEYRHGGPGVCLGDGQTEVYLRNMGMTGPASAWAMARRRTKEYRREVDAATRCSGLFPPHLTWYITYIGMIIIVKIPACYMSRVVEML